MARNNRVIPSDSGSVMQSAKTTFEQMGGGGGGATRPSRVGSSVTVLQADPPAGAAKNLEKKAPFLLQSVVGAFRRNVEIANERKAKLEESSKGGKKHRAVSYGDHITLKLQLNGRPQGYIYAENLDVPTASESPLRSMSSSTAALDGGGGGPASHDLSPPVLVNPGKSGTGRHIFDDLSQNPYAYTFEIHARGTSDASEIYLERKRELEVLEEELTKKRSLYLERIKTIQGYNARKELSCKKTKKDPNLKQESTAIDEKQKEVDRKQVDVRDAFKLRNKERDRLRKAHAKKKTSPLRYGESIFLKHSLTDKYLFINSDREAGRVGAVNAVELTSHLRNGCHFVVKSFDSAFNDGDKVREGDIINLVYKQEKADWSMARSFSKFDHAALKEHQHMFPIAVIATNTRPAGFRIDVYNRGDAHGPFTLHGGSVVKIASQGAQLVCTNFVNDRSTAASNDLETSGDAGLWPYMNAKRGADGALLHEALGYFSLRHTDTDMMGNRIDPAQNVSEGALNEATPICFTHILTRKFLAITTDSHGNDVVGSSTHFGLNGGEGVFYLVVVGRRRAKGLATSGVQYKIYHPATKSYLTRTDMPVPRVVKVVMDDGTQQSRVVIDDDELSLAVVKHKEPSSTTVGKAAPNQQTNFVVVKVAEDDKDDAFTVLSTLRFLETAKKRINKVAFDIRVKGGDGLKGEDQRQQFADVARVAETISLRLADFLEDQDHDDDVSEWNKETYRRQRLLVDTGALEILLDLIKEPITVSTEELLNYATRSPPAHPAAVIARFDNRLSPEMLAEPQIYKYRVLESGHFKCPECKKPSRALLERPPMIDANGDRYYANMVCCICQTTEVNCMHSECNHVITCTACSLVDAESSAVDNWGLGGPSELRDSTSCLPVDAGDGDGGGAAGAAAGSGGAAGGSADGDDAAADRASVLGQFSQFRALWEACFRCLGVAARGSLTGTDDALRGYLVPLLKHVVLLKTQNSMEVVVELLGDKREILDDVFNSEIPFYEYDDPKKELARIQFDAAAASPQPYTMVDGTENFKISIYDWLTSFMVGGPQLDRLGLASDRFELVDSDYFLVLAECCQCKGLASYSAQLKIGKMLNHEVWGLIVELDRSGREIDQAFADKFKAKLNSRPLVQKGCLFTLGSIVENGDKQSVVNSGSGKLLKQFRLSTTGWKETAKLSTVESIIASQPDLDRFMSQLELVAKLCTGALLAKDVDSVYFRKATAISYPPEALMAVVKDVTVPHRIRLKCLQVFFDVHIDAGGVATAKIRPQYIYLAKSDELHDRQVRKASSFADIRNREGDADAIFELFRSYMIRETGRNKAHSFQIDLEAWVADMKKCCDNEDFEFEPEEEDSDKHYGRGMFILYALKCLKYYFDHDFISLSTNASDNAHVETILIMLADTVISKQKDLGTKTGNATSANDIQRNAVISAVQVACLDIFEAVLRHKEWTISKKIVSVYSAKCAGQDDAKLAKVAHEAMHNVGSELTFQKLLPRFIAKHPQGIREHLFLAAENGSDELAQHSVGLLHRIFEGTFRSMESLLKTYILEQSTAESDVHTALLNPCQLLRRITYGSQIDNSAAHALLDDVFGEVAKLCKDVDGAVNRAFQIIIHRSHYLDDIFDLLDQDFDDEQLQTAVAVDPASHDAAGTALAACFDQMCMVNANHYLVSKDIFEELKNIVRKPSIRFPAIAVKAAEAFATCFHLPNLCSDVAKSHVEAIFDLFIESMTEDKSHASVQSTLWPVSSLLDLMRLMASPALGLEPTLEMFGSVERNINMLYEVCLGSNVSDREILFSLLKRNPAVNDGDKGKMHVVEGMVAGAGSNGTNKHWLELKTGPKRPQFEPKPAVLSHISLVEFLNVLASTQKSEHKTSILTYCRDVLPLKESLYFLQCWTSGQRQDPEVQDWINSKARFAHLTFINTLYIADSSLLMSKMEECEIDLANVVKICIASLNQFITMAIQSPDQMATWYDHGKDRLWFLFFVLGAALPFLSELLITDAWPNVYPSGGGSAGANFVQETVAVGSSPSKSFSSSYSAWNDHTEDFADCMGHLTGILPDIFNQLQVRLLASGVDPDQVTMLRVIANAGDAVRQCIGNMTGDQLVRMKKDKAEAFYKQMDENKTAVLKYLHAQVFNNPQQAKSWKTTLVQRGKKSGVEVANYHMATASFAGDALGLQSTFFGPSNDDAGSIGDGMMLQDHTQGTDVWSSGESPQHRMSQVTPQVIGHHSKFRDFVILCANTQMTAGYDHPVVLDHKKDEEDTMELDFSEMKSFVNQIAYWNGVSFADIRSHGSDLNADDLVPDPVQANQRMALLDRYLTTIELTLDQEGTLDDAVIENAEDNAQKVMEILQGILQQHNSHGGVVDLEKLRAEQGRLADSGSMVQHCVRLIANQTKEAVNRDAIELLSSMLDGNDAGKVSPVREALASYLETSLSSGDGVAAGFLSTMDSLMFRYVDALDVRLGSDAADNVHRKPEYRYMDTLLYTLQMMSDGGHEDSSSHERIQAILGGSEDGTPNFIRTLGFVCRRLTKHLQSAPSWGELVRQLLDTACALCSGDYVPNKQAALDGPFMQCLDSILTQGASTIARNHTVTCGKRMVFKFLHCLVESNAPYTEQIAVEIQDRLVLDELLNACADLLTMSIFFRIHPSLDKPDLSAIKAHHRYRFFRNRRYQKQLPSVLNRETAFDCWVVLERFSRLTPWFPRGIDTTGTNTTLEQRGAAKKEWQQHMQVMVGTMKAHAAAKTPQQKRDFMNTMSTLSGGTLTRRRSFVEDLATIEANDALFLQFRKDFIDGDEDDEANRFGSTLIVQAQTLLRDFDCFGYFQTVARKIEVHLNGVNELLYFMPKKDWEYDDLPVSLKHHVKDVVLDYSGTTAQKVKSLIKSYTEMEIQLHHRKALGESQAVEYLLTADHVAPVIDLLMLSTTIILNVLMLVIWEGDANSFDSARPEYRPEYAMTAGISPSSVNVIFKVFGTFHLVFCSWLVMHHVMTLWTEQVWNLVYKCTLFLLSFFSVAAPYSWTPYLYGLHLIHVMEAHYLRDHLRAVKFSVTQNIGALLLTLLLLLVFVYMASLVAFAIFRGSYDQAEGMFCDSLLQCFLTTTTFGLRMGGGIGDALVVETEFGREWLTRFFFDIIFFLVVPVIGMNLVLGVIVDSFSEKRSDDAERATLKSAACVVCGKTAAYFDTLTSEGFAKHVSEEHNFWDYFAALATVNATPYEHCTHIERAIKIKWVDIEDEGSADLSMFPFDRQGNHVLQQTASAELLAERVGRIEESLQEIREALKKK